MKNSVAYIYCLTYLCLKCGTSSHGAEPEVGFGEFVISGGSKCIIIEKLLNSAEDQPKSADKLLYDFEWSGTCTIERKGERIAAIQKLLLAEKTKLLARDSQEETISLVVEGDGSLEYRTPQPHVLSYFPFPQMPYDAFGIGSGRFNSYVKFIPLRFGQSFECNWFPSQKRNEDQVTVEGPVLTHDIENSIYGTGYLTRILVGDQIVESTSEWHTVLSLDELKKRSEFMRLVPKRDNANVLASNGVRFKSNQSVKRKMLKGK